MAQILVSTDGKNNDVSSLGYPPATTIRDVILDSLKGIMEP